MPGPFDKGREFSSAIRRCGALTLGLFGRAGNMLLFVCLKAEKACDILPE